MTRPAYLIVTIDFHDIEAFGRYAEQVLPLIQEYGGEILAATPNLTVEYGAWPRQRVTLVKFPSRAQAERFYQSDAYQPMKALRESASDGDLILVDSLLEEGPEAPKEQSTPHYLLGASTVTDPGFIAEYQEKVPPVSAQFGVQALAMGNEFTVLEGSWPRENMVLLKFPSAQAFKEFWYGEGYRPMKELREANSIGENISFAGVVE